MSEVKINYYYKGEPYNLTSGAFDVEHVKSLSTYFHQRCHLFAEEINRQGGYLEVEISKAENNPKSIHFEMKVLGIDQGLTEKINDSGVFQH